MLSEAGAEHVCCGQVRTISTFILFLTDFISFESKLGAGKPVKSQWVSFKLFQTVSPCWCGHLRLYVTASSANSLLTICVLTVEIVLEYGRNFGLC
jgi:hypothetical protein